MIFKKIKELQILILEFQLVIEFEQTLFSESKLLQKPVKHITHLIAHIICLKNGYSFSLQEKWKLKIH